MDFIGDKFHMFNKAKDFLQSFGGLEINWKNQSSVRKYNYLLKIGGNEADLRILWLKWYMIYFNRLLYPVANYCAWDSDLLIDTDGNFYFVNETTVADAGNDFFSLLSDLINAERNVIVNHRQIPDWEEAGYSDEFIEQWNYDFDALEKQ